MKWREGVSLAGIYNIPPGLIKIIKKATNPDHAKRYQSCAELTVAIFDVRKTLKSWWIDGLHIYARSKKGDRTFMIENFKSTPQLKVSVNNSNFRNRNGGGSLEKIIEYIAKD